MSLFALIGSLGAILFSFFGTGLPVGIPPEKEDAIMAHVAPEECVLYASWSATAIPSSASANQTEQLLAEPEVRAFASAVRDNLLAAAVAGAQKGGMTADQADKLGKFASLWLGTLFKNSGALYVSQLAPRDQGLDLQGALIIKANETAAELERSFTESIKDEGLAISEATLAGRKFNKITLPTGAPLDLVWSSGNGFFLLGIGPAAMEQMSARIRAQKEPAWLTQLKANLPVERRSTITYVNIKRLMEAFLPLADPKADKTITALGLKQLTAFQSVTGLDKTRMITRSLLAIEGQPKGLLALLDDKGLTDNDLNHVPYDSLSALALALDLSKVFNLALAAFVEVDPQAGEQVKQAMALGQALLGTSVAEALGALGRRWTLHSPADGGGLGTVIVAEVRNKSRLATVEKTLLSKIANQAGEIPNVGRITRSTVAGQSIASFVPKGPSPIALSWCLTDKQLIFALNPQAIKSILSRQTGDGSLAEVPEIASPLISASLIGASDPLAITYHDTPRSFAAMYAQANAFIPLLNSTAEKAGIPFRLDPAQLPAQRSISQHLLPSVMMVRRTAQGLELESRKTYPGLNANPAMLGMTAALLLPAIQAGRDAAKREAAAAKAGK